VTLGHSLALFQEAALCLCRNESLVDVMISAWVNTSVKSDLNTFLSISKFLARRDSASFVLSKVSYFSQKRLVDWPKQIEAADSSLTRSI